MKKEVVITIERSEARAIQNKIDFAKDKVRFVFQNEVERLLKKRGIDNAIPPYELTLSFPGASLTYHEA